MNSVNAGTFELTGISGASLAQGENALGLRLLFLHESLGVFDGKDLPLSISAAPVHAPDLSYVRYEWRVPVTVEGIRRYVGVPRRSCVNSPAVIAYELGEAATVTLEWPFDGKTLSGCYTSDKAARFALVINGCFAPARVTAAVADGCCLEQGESTLQVKLRGKTEEPILFDEMLTLQQVWAGISGVKRGTASVAYPVTVGPEEPLVFAMSPEDFEMQDPTASLADASRRYEAVRMRSTGDFADAAEAVASLSGYSRTYDPERQMLQTTVNRTWGGVNRPGLVFGWDNFFTSFVSAWEDPQLAAASLEHIVGVYGENGIKKGPTQRNLIIPVIYCRTIHVLGDYSLARRTWATMMEFMRFWFPNRDGNGDGLIEAGVSKDATSHDPGRLIQEAMDETGYDEISIYSAGFTDGRRGLLAPGVRFDWASKCLTVTLVCQNALYITACHAMSALARKIDQESDAVWLDGEAERVAKRMREHLFCEMEGIFRDRFWEGGFSPVTAMTIFFPLLAGIADRDVKEKLLAALTDPKQFWGENLIPTVSRRDPTYCDGYGGKGNYWRGNCWAPATYMVYLAAKTAGWDETVAEYGRRTHVQFMEYWRTHAHAYENYPPEGKVDHDFVFVNNLGGREIRYAWAAMMLFCGLEELFGVEIDGSLRFGNPYLSKQSKWDGFFYQGRRVRAEAGQERLEIAIDGAWEFTAQPGITVRGFVTEPRRFRFTATALAVTRIEMRAPSLTAYAKVLAEGCVLEAEARQGRIAFALPAGKSGVVIEMGETGVLTPISLA